MHDRRLKSSLGKLHDSGANDRLRPEHRTELESRLLARYRTQQPRKRRWLMLLNPWNRTTRFALVGLAMIVLGVGACTTSTTTEMEMGQKMTISLSDKSNLEIDAVDADLMAFLNTQPGIENVSVNIREMMNGPVTFEILAWGTGLNAETLEAKMRRQVPSLGSADIQMEALSGTIEESFASKLKREIFQLEVDGASEEEIRAQIMQQLAAQGLENGAVVDVQMEDGMTEIKVKVEKDVPAE